MIYGYVRISTKCQSPQRQVDNILTNYPTAKIYTDICSGKNSNRLNWNILNSIVQNNDLIIFDELSRLSRDSDYGYKTYLSLLSRGVNLIFIKTPEYNTNNTLLSLSQIKEAFKHAEEEKNLIIQRTVDGKTKKRKNDPNYKEGRPSKYTTKQLDRAMTLLQTYSYKEVVKITGISKSTLIRYKKRIQNG